MKNKNTKKSETYKKIGIGAAVVVVHDLHMIAAHIEDALQKLEMDRRHLRAEDGVVLPHFLCPDAMPRNQAAA